MSPFFAILIVRVPFHAPGRGGGNMLANVAKQSMGVQLSDRSRTIEMRESPRQSPHPADGISSYDDHAQEHFHPFPADATALVAQPDQMLEMRVGSVLSCHELERVQ